MGTVICKNKDKVSEINENWWKIFNLKIIKNKNYFSIHESIDEVIFQDCTFDGDYYFEVPADQKLSFIGCKFFKRSRLYESITIAGNSDSKNSILIKDSNFVDFGLNIVDCDFVSLDLKNSDNEFDNIDVRANTIDITGNFRVNHQCNLNAKDRIEMKDACPKTYGHIRLKSNNLDIYNSIFNICGTDSLDINFTNLSMDDVIFYIESTSVINFNDNNGNKTSYKGPSQLSDSDLKDEKNMQIYKFLSVLKGYCDKNNKINDRDINHEVNKISISYEMELNRIQKQIELLEKQKEELIVEKNNDKEQVKQELSNRKVKSLAYTKE